MIEKTIAAWHDLLRGKHPGGLDSLLADDVVFHSPIVFTPQKGKEVTKLYLNAAGNTLGGESSSSHDGGVEGASSSDDRKFRYTKEILSGNHAVLEFETWIGDKYVNGIDMITCNDDGQIIEFKVMVRPLQAINLLHQQMAAMLKKLQGEAD